LPSTPQTMVLPSTPQTMVLPSTPQTMVLPNAAGVPRGGRCWSQGRSNESGETIRCSGLAM
jgi:hypothetical protein